MKRILPFLLLLIGAIPAAAQTYTRLDQMPIQSPSSSGYMVVINNPNTGSANIRLQLMSGIVGLNTVSPGTILGNVTGSAAVPTSVSISTVLDYLLGSTQGAIAVRGASAWTSIPAVTSGKFLRSNGTLTAPSYEDLPSGLVIGGSSGQIQYNNSGSLGGFTVSGDATLNTSTGVLTLGASGVTATSYGSATAVPVITFDAKGRATAASTASIAAYNKRVLSVPFVGVTTSGDPDIYEAPQGATFAIAASTVPTPLCRVNPAASTTFVVKKWTSGNPATSSTLCTGTISTSCAISSCSISATSIVGGASVGTPGDGLSIEVSAASADTAARFTISIPGQIQ